MIFNSAIDISKAILLPVEFPQKVPVKVFMKRLDMIHPTIYGNKWLVRAEIRHNKRPSK